MKTKIIAEVGVNHNGSVLLAKKFILAAKKIGIKIIKFQFYTAEKLIMPNTPMAAYQKKNYKNKKTLDQFKMLKKFELSLSEHIQLSKFCKINGLEYCCSLFHEDDVKYVNRLGLKRIKIPSGEINNFFLLKKVAKLNKNLILSTGMSTDDEVSKAIRFLIINGQSKKKIVVLHCCSSYPTLVPDLNLNMIGYIKNRYKVSVGFSDHSENIETPMMAVLKGAELIEKHVTLSKKMKGPDHKVSLNIKEFKRMISLVKDAEDAMGLSKKKVTSSEKKNIFYVRKSLVSKKNINKGEKFTLKNLTAKRPVSGISVGKLEYILGKKAKKNYKKNEII